MNCGRVSNQLSAYVDRELTGAEMLHIRSHLGACESCRAEHEALYRMKMMLGRLKKGGVIAGDGGRYTTLERRHELKHAHPNGHTVTTSLIGEVTQDTVLHSEGRRAALMQARGRAMTASARWGYSGRQ